MTIMVKRLLLFVLAAALLSLAPHSPVLADSSGTSFTITMVNNSTVSINNVRVADYDTGDFSPDLLGSSQTIEPGNSATLTFTDYRNECTFRVKITTFPTGGVSGTNPTYTVLQHNFCDYPTMTVVDNNS
jgi:hypothetical protein